MEGLWAVLLPILVADVLNPVLFAFLVYAAGSSRPIINSCVMLLGHTLAYFIAGIVIALGIDSVTDRLANPQRIDYFLGLGIGAILVWAAWRTRKGESKKPEADGGDLSTGQALGLGAMVCLFGLPFGVPYFAAIDQILKADLDTPSALLVLTGYNLLYTTAFLVVPILVALLGEQSRPLLQRINNWLTQASNLLIPLLLLVLGVALIADAIMYFTQGVGLF